MLKFWKHDAQMLNNCAASAIKQSKNPQGFRLKQRVRRLQASAMAEHGALATGETVHKKAAALRKKYVMGQYRVRPGFVGFHPSNRVGLAPNGERCVSLLKSIIRDGYDAAEGDHTAICVQEVPGSTCAAPRREFATGRCAAQHRARVVVLKESIAICAT